MQLKKKVTDAHCTDKVSLVFTSPGFTLRSDSARRFNLNLLQRITAKLLCGLEASQGTVEEVLSSAASVKADDVDSNDDLDPDEDGENERKVGRKKKNKRRKGIISKVVFFFKHAQV